MQAKKRITKVIHIEANYYTIMRTAMEHKRISWQSMADLIGVSKMGLYKSFKNETLTISNMLAICQVLGLDPVELFQQDSFIAAEPTPDYGTPAQQVNNKLKQVHQLCTEIEAICKENAASTTGKV